MRVLERLQQINPRKNDETFLLVTRHGQRVACGLYAGHTMRTLKILFAPSAEQNIQIDATLDIEVISPLAFSNLINSIMRYASRLDSNRPIEGNEVAKELSRIIDTSLRKT